MTHALHLTAWHPVIDGFSGVFVIEQCAALRSHGAQIGLIFSRIQGLRDMSPKRFLRGLPAMVHQSDPVPSFGFKSWNILGMNGCVQPFNSQMLSNRYSAYVRAHGSPDILHAHVAIESGVAARAISRRTGLDYVVTEHSTEILNGNMQSARINMARKVYADARCVIAVSRPLADRISNICPSANVVVINNLVRDGVFQLKRKYQNQSQTLRIVTIGALVAHKKTENAMLALSALPEALKTRIEHHIIGGGPDRQKLDELAAKNGVKTRFHGIISHLDAMAILSQADLLLHSSSYETFGVVLAEAMALGVPVIATRCGGPEFIVTEATGKLVPIDDIPALTQAVNEILNRMEHWRKQITAISQYAEKQYHEKHVSALILDTYR